MNLESIMRLVERRTHKGACGELAGRFEEKDARIKTLEKQLEIIRGGRCVNGKCEFKKSCAAFDEMKTKKTLEAALDDACGRLWKYGYCCDNNKRLRGECDENCAECFIKYHTKKGAKNVD